MDNRRVEIAREVDVAAARIAARELAATLGFPPAALCAIVTSVSELASNVLIHGGGGALELRAMRGGGEAGIEVRAGDDGPGIGDVLAAMRDGVSTAGSLGEGLPAVNRLMHELEISTSHGGGCQITARRFVADRRRRPPPPEEGWTKVENPRPFGPCYARRSGATTAFRAED